MSTPLIDSYRGIKVNLPPVDPKHSAALKEIKHLWLNEFSDLKDNERQLLVAMTEAFLEPGSHFGTRSHGEITCDFGEMLHYLDNSADSLKYLYEFYCRKEGCAERASIAHVIYEITVFFETYFSPLIHQADPSSSRLSPAKVLISHYSVLNMSTCSMGGLTTLDDLKRLKQQHQAKSKATRDATASTPKAQEVPKVEMTKEQLQHFLETPESFLRELFTAYSRIPHRMQGLIQGFMQYLKTQFVREQRYKKVIFYEALFQVISVGQFSEDFDSIELAFSMAKIFRDDEDASLLLGYVRRKVDKLAGEITNSLEFPPLPKPRKP